MDTWILEYLNTGILEYWNTWILEYLNTGILEYLNTWILEHFCILMSDLVFFWNFLKQCFWFLSTFIIFHFEFILILNCKLFGSSVHRHDIDQKMKFEFIVWQNWYWCSSQASIALTYFDIFRTSPAWTRSPRWPWCGLSSSSSAS